MGYNKGLISSSSSSSSSIIFSKSLLVLIIPMVFSQYSLLNYSCSVVGYYNSNYSLSLTYLMDDLCANAPKHNGFRMASWAEDPSNTIYGLALCQYDMSSEYCDTCLTDATIKLTNISCPNSRRGAIILEGDYYCLLKYSDTDFRGQLDSQIYYNLSGRSIFPGLHLCPESAMFLTNLSDNATATPDMLFATGVKETENATFYGTVQCTTDISLLDCKKCLKDAIRDLFSWCTNQIGADAFYGSCIITYRVLLK
ncbi:hypothetical protein CASFOL_030884 [Castilleja foliolosa]|uniref:Gnk2-homologous domain-containing protein n=1 Tax=Castilleja foliolosa TaxID=1961234 RepID=A0ABD3C6L2_9LAMI